VERVDPEALSVTAAKSDRLLTRLSAIWMVLRAWKRSMFAFPLDWLIETLVWFRSTYHENGWIG
jgi:hypothetical protein